MAVFPILALTAHALTPSSGASLEAAGMDEHLTKLPILPRCASICSAIEPAVGAVSSGFAERGPRRSLSV